MAWIWSNHLQWKFKLLAGVIIEKIRRNIVGWCQQTFCFQKFLDNSQQCFAFTPQTNFPAQKVVRSNPGYLLKHFLFYLKDETIDIVMARAATRGKTSEMEENGDSSSGTWWCGCQWQCHCGGPEDEHFLKLSITAENLFT